MPNDTDAARPQTGIEIIAAERERQMRVEGWTPEHDDEHIGGELAAAAACYAIFPDDPPFPPGRPPYGWPWAAEWWKPGPRSLAKAGALYLAERDRMQRAHDRIAAEIDRLQRRNP
jgi:hypothetical protein